MKRISVILITLIFLNIFLTPLILGDSADNIGRAIDSQAEQLEGQIDDIESLTKEDIKWEYLSQEIQKIILKNKIIASIDKVLKKINFLFVAIFGQPYSLSLIFFTSTIIFFYIFWSFREILKNYSMFSEGTSDIIAFLLCVIMAQLKIYEKASELIFKFIFYNEGWLAWIRTAIIIAILIGLNYALRWGGTIQQKRREKMEKLKTKLATKTIQLTAKAVKPINEALRKK